MTPSSPEVVWHAAAAVPATTFGRLNAHQLGNLDVYVATDHTGSRHLLLGVGAVDESSNDDRSRGLHVVSRTLEVEGQDPRSFIDVECVDPGGNDDFRAVSQEIVDAVAQGAAPGEAVRLTLARWRRFWGVVPADGLSADQLRGLFGELWFLAFWLLPLSNRAITHWAGPAGARHDFQWSGIAVEAKATASIRGHIHRINGIEQLDPPPGVPLYVFSLRVRDEQTASNSLGTLIARIRDRLAADADLRDALDSGLALAGYSPAHANRYESTRFRVVDERLYTVVGAFPRITETSLVSGLPPGVERVDYEVNLESCVELCVARRPSEFLVALSTTGGTSAATSVTATE